MSMIYCTECGKQYSDKARACPNCGCPTDDEYVASLTVASPALAAVQDAFPREQVVQHLSYAAALEKTIYTYQKAHERLEARIRNLGHPQRIQQPPPLGGYDIFSPLWIFFPVFLIALIFLSINSGDFFGDLFSVLLILPIFFNNALLKRAGIAALISAGVVAVLVLIKSIAGLVKQNKQMQTYNVLLEQDQRRVAYEQNIVRQLRQQQAVIKNHMKNNSFLLEKLYNLDVIFPKYRHMVAITTILEYFQSRRCAQLSGHEGAYNLYEYEETQKIIIGKLDTAISLLDDIRRSQHMLYEAICDANETLQRIQSQSERILDASGRIAENTALTAYNTSVIRQNTSISAYIDAFR